MLVGPPRQRFRNVFGRSRRAPGRNGGAIADVLRREIPELIEGREADDTEAIWHHVWWALHYGGRGGPAVLALSALDIALWDLKARRANLPLFGLLGGFDARVPCYAGGIDLDLSVEALLRQTDENLAKGFRAVKMKVGRPDLGSDVTRVGSTAISSTRSRSTKAWLWRQRDQVTVSPSTGRGWRSSRNNWSSWWQYSMNEADRPKDSSCLLLPLGATAFVDTVLTRRLSRNETEKGKPPSH